MCNKSPHNLVHCRSLSRILQEFRFLCPLKCIRGFVFLAAPRNVLCRAKRIVYGTETYMLDSALSQFYPSTLQSFAYHGLVLACDAVGGSRMAVVSENIRGVELEQSPDRPLRSRPTDILYFVEIFRTLSKDPQDLQRSFQSDQEMYPKRTESRGSVAGSGSPFKRCRHGRPLCVPNDA